MTSAIDRFSSYLILSALTLRLCSVLLREFSVGWAWNGLPLTFTIACLWAISILSVCKSGAALLRLKLNLAIIYLLPCLIIIFSVVFEEPLFHFADIGKFYAFRDFYNQCASQATSIDNIGAFGICENYRAQEQDEAVIYDSTDQIIKAKDDRSPEWRRVVRKLDRAAPFGILQFRVKRIADHFYKVDFSTGDTPGMSSDI